VKVGIGADVENGVKTKKDNDTKGITFIVHKEKQMIVNPNRIA
jgi:hypothetical protein